jgi:putative hydrolase of the HAD superfamily
MRHRAVIFDLFGTLIDNFSAAEYRGMLEQMAGMLAAPVEGFIRLWRKTVGERMAGEFPTVEAGIAHVCTGLGVEADESKVAAAAGVRVEFTRRGLTPRQGALRLLTELRASGRRVGLVTNCTIEVPMLWGETPFAPLVDEAVFSCVARAAKPDPRIYQMACERLAVGPGECVYVGDGANRELRAAAEVGMEPVLLRVPYDDPKEWDRAEAAEWEGETVSALTGVLQLLE